MDMYAILVLPRQICCIQKIAPSLIGCNSHTWLTSMLLQTVSMYNTGILRIAQLCPTVFRIGIQNWKKKQTEAWLLYITDLALNPDYVPLFAHNHIFLNTKA